MAVKTPVQAATKRKFEAGERRHDDGVDVLLVELSVVHEPADARDIAVGIGIRVRARPIEPIGRGVVINDVNAVATRTRRQDLVRDPDLRGERLPVNEDAGVLRQRGELPDPRLHRLSLAVTACQAARFEANCAFVKYPSLRSNGTSGRKVKPYAHKPFHWLASGSTKEADMT